MTTMPERVRAWWTRLRLGVSPHDEPVIAALTDFVRAEAERARDGNARKSGKMLASGTSRGWSWSLSDTIHGPVLRFENKHARHAVALDGVFKAFERDYARMEAHK